jgi:shikimate kinase
MRRQLIVLIGFMGSGKTTVGTLLAARLGYEMIDTDDLVVQRAGIPVSQIFGDRGESAFRAIESEVLDSLGSRTGVVVATGGGAPAQPRNRGFFTNSPATFHLRVSLKGARERTSGNATRPLLSQEEDAVRRLFADRLPIYEALGVPVETEGLTPGEVVERIVLLLEGPTLKGSPGGAA